MKILLCSEDTGRTAHNTNKETNKPTNQLTNQPTNQVNSWKRFLLEKLTVPQLIKKFPAFYETLRCITCEQQPSVCVCPEADRSSARCPHYVWKVHFIRNINYNYYHHHHPIQSNPSIIVMYTRVSTPKFSMQFFSPRYVLHTLPTVYFLA